MGVRGGGGARGGEGTGSLNKQFEEIGKVQGVLRTLFLGRQCGQGCMVEAEKETE